MVEDSSKSIFSRGTLNYGLNRPHYHWRRGRILSNIRNEPSCPFSIFHSGWRQVCFFQLNICIMWDSKVFSITHRHRVFSFELDYTRYHEGQTAINFNYPWGTKSYFFNACPCKEYIPSSWGWPLIRSYCQQPIYNSWIRFIRCLPWCRHQPLQLMPFP